MFLARQFLGLCSRIWYRQHACWSIGHSNPANITNSPATDSERLNLLRFLGANAWSSNMRFCPLTVQTAMKLGCRNWGWLFSEGPLFSPSPSRHRNKDWRPLFQSGVRCYCIQATAKTKLCNLSWLKERLSVDTSQGQVQTNASDRWFLEFFLGTPGSKNWGVCFCPITSNQDLPQQKNMFPSPSQKAIPDQECHIMPWCRTSNQKIYKSITFIAYGRVKNTKSNSLILNASHPFNPSVPFRPTNSNG